MVYKDYRIVIIIKIILLTGTIVVFLYTLLISKLYLASALLAGISVLQIYLIFRVIDKTNRELISFLDSIRYSEFSRSFNSKNISGSYRELYNAFNDVIKDFQTVRAEKEKNLHYIQSVLQILDTSILVYKKSGEVELVNDSAKRLFQKDTLQRIDSLASISNELTTTLLKILPGESKLLKVTVDDEVLQLLFFATELKTEEKDIIVVTIKNLQSVLDEYEVDAWQKLISVLTHEIMNSITPIASLSSILNDMLPESLNYEKKSEPGGKTLSDIRLALKTINKRSTGLLNFVSNYRNLTKIPNPVFQFVRVIDLLENLSKLYLDDLRMQKIALSTDIVPDDLTIEADEQLIEQVLINLINNSIHAVKNVKKPEIGLRAFLNKRKQPVIQVTDNGVGILDEVIDKIFIPFFTTKQQGSGIGLSLSRQIMRLHNSNISVKSIPEKGTIMTLVFQPIRITD